MQNNALTFHLDMLTPAIEKGMSELNLRFVNYNTISGNTTTIKRFGDGSGGTFPYGLLYDFCWLVEYTEEVPLLSKMTDLLEDSNRCLIKALRDVYRTEGIFSVEAYIDEQCEREPHQTIIAKSVEDARVKKELFDSLKTPSMELLEEEFAISFYGRMNRVVCDGLGQETDEHGHPLSPSWKVLPTDPKGWEEWAAKELETQRRLQREFIERWS